MNELILGLSTLFCAGGLNVVTKKLNKEVKLFKKSLLLSEIVNKALSLLLFVVYIPYLFMMEEISNQIGLEGGVYSPFITVLFAILKWVTYFSIAVTVIKPFFNKKSLNDYVSFFVPVIVLLNVVFLSNWSTLVTGGVNYFDIRIILYSVALAIMGAISISSLINVIVRKDFKGVLKRLICALAFMAIYLMAYMPEFIPQLFFGYTGGETQGFTVTHRLLIYACIGFIFIGYFVMHKKSYEDKMVFLILLSMSGFMQYFAINAHRGPLHYPLHLCNTAIIIMLFTYVFKLQGLFYFTYLINVLGAAFAILLPNTAENLLTQQSTIVYWYNHTYAFVLPIFGVSLKIFPRPNLNMVKKGIIAFTVYVLFAATFNAWLNNSPLNPDRIEVDYFFLYGDFLINKFPFAIPIKYNYVLTFTLGGTTFVYYWLYVLVVWVVFVACIFVIWGAYALMYRIGDSFSELYRRKRIIKDEYLSLLKEMKGRKLSEPLHPEGERMIKIKNFSKCYAGSNKKAVDNINLEVYEGEVFGFIGHNGAGKSTTIKSLVGIQSITDGSIEIQGFDIARQPLEAKLRMGYVSDNHAVYENLTGREYISYVADLYMVSEKDKNERLEKYAKMFHLEKALDSEIKCYSHGMKQKTMVIGALIHNPKVWVLDEPLTGLDPTSSYQIKECMRQHANEGNIVFFSSHVIEVVEKICDRIAIISGGKICRVDSVKNILSEGKSLEDVYLEYAQGNVLQDSESERN